MFRATKIILAFVVILAIFNSGISEHTKETNGEIFTSAIQNASSVLDAKMSAPFRVGTGRQHSTVVLAIADGVAGALLDVSASPTLSLDKPSGPVGTFVSLFGSGYLGKTCHVASVPAGLFDSAVCSIDAVGALTGNFTVASSAATGSYTVLVQTDAGSGDSATSLFTVVPASYTTTVTTTTPSITTSGTSITTSSTTTTAGPAPPRCIVATVTFGSEVSPAVQFLRSFRDRLVLSTRAGSAFMEVFNAWYYSFSPQVANIIMSNDALRVAVRLTLYPLLGALALSALAYSAFGSVPELAIIVAGAVASSLVGLVYLTPVAIVSMRLVLRRRIRLKPSTPRRVSMMAFTSALMLLAAGELAGSSLILAIASSGLVLICLIAVPIVVAFATLRPSSR